MSSFIPLPIPPTFTTWQGHQIANYRTGSGSTILLIHSINAAASAFEMRGPFLGLSDCFHLHALDLLGFGCSDRPERRYSPDDYIDLIGQTIQELGENITIIASSLSTTYAVRAAEQHPDRIRAIILICPVGISQLAQPPTAVQQGLYKVLRGPVGTAFFQGLTSRAALRRYLKRDAYANAASITADVLDSFYTTSHQPGAKHAPICFVTNLLNCDMSEEFAALRIPIMIVWGREAKTSPLAKADEFLMLNPLARLAVLDECSMLAQDERPDEFNALVREFLS